jgi:flagellar motor component MotA
LPIAGKLNVYAQEEVFLEELIIEGVQCIQQNEVPALTLRKLRSFAEAHKRDQLQTATAPGGTQATPGRRAA